MPDTTGVSDAVQRLASSTAEANELATQVHEAASEGAVSAGMRDAAAVKAQLLRRAAQIGQTESTKRELEFVL
ncbi:MAG: hypothetical protein ABGW82_06315, partial [Paracoccus sp. (in: a-proteobacteria)]